MNSPDNTEYNCTQGEPTVSGFTKGVVSLLWGQGGNDLGEGIRPERVEIGVALERRLAMDLAKGMLEVRTVLGFPTEPEIDHGEARPAKRFDQSL